MKWVLVLCICLSGVVVTATDLELIYHVPAPATIARYELNTGGTWVPMSMADGQTVLGCCQNLSKFETWRPDTTSGITHAYKFRVITTQNHTNELFTLDESGEYLSYIPHSIGRLLAFPEEQRRKVASILTAFQKPMPGRTSPTPLVRSYTIGSEDDGGSLWGIAKHFYDDGTRWSEIYEANTNVIKNPDRIRNGMVIVIPGLNEAK